MRLLNMLRKRLKLDEATAELEDKTYEQIQIETAWKWGSRAVAAYKLGDPQAQEYEHEALEHAALVDDSGQLIAELTKEMSKYKLPIELLGPAQVLYLESPKGTNGVACDNCVHWNDHARCELFGPDDEVKADEICYLYLPGDPRNAPSMSFISPKAAGLGQGRTNCGSCAYGNGSPLCLHPYNERFKINNERGCCNTWVWKKEEIEKQSMVVPSAHGKPKPHKELNSPPDRTSDEAATDFDNRGHKLPMFPKLSKSEVDYFEYATGDGLIVYKEANHEGVMVALRLPKDVAGQLAVEGGEDSRDLHLTLAYIAGSVDDISRDVLQSVHDALTGVQSRFAPFAGTIAGYGVFRPESNADGQWVLYASLDSPMLPALRHAIVQACTDAGAPPMMNHGFTPHITLRYFDGGEYPDGDIPIPDIPFVEMEFNAFSFVMGGTEAIMKLNGTPPLEQPQETLEDETFSEIMTSEVVTDDISMIEQWAQNKGELVVQPLVSGLGCILVKKGLDITLAIAGFDGEDVQADDLLTALQAIEHDFVIQGALCARDIQGRWLSAEAIPAVLATEEIASLVFMPQDIFILDGDISSKPFTARWAALEKLLEPAGSRVILPPAQFSADIPSATVQEDIDEVLAWEAPDAEGLEVLGARVIRSEAPYTHGQTDDMAILLTGVRKDVFGTVGTHGILAPGQGIFRKPRRRQRKDVHGIETSPPGVYPPAEQRGWFLTPTEKGQNVGISIALPTFLTKSGVAGGGSGDGDGTQNPPVFGAHTFVVGQLKDGLWQEDDLVRVNPYEALFQRGFKLTTWAEAEPDVEVLKEWSDEARAAALEARRRKASLRGIGEIEREPNYRGKPVQTRRRLTKEQTRAISEGLAAKLYRAKPLNVPGSGNNYPLDLAGKGVAYEVKGGAIGVTAGAQHWRLTQGQPSNIYKKWRAKVSESTASKFLDKKQGEIVQRKMAALKELEKKQGRKIKMKTITMIVDPDKRKADIFEFDGFHHRIGWNSEQAKKGYRATVRY